MDNVLPTRRFVEPSVVTSHFLLREGDVVADFGAGSGFFVEILSRAVGPQGVVHALEIQKELVEKIGDIARQKGLANVNPKWCDIESLNGTGLPDESLDVAIMVNTLFQFEDKPTGLREVERTLHAGGKFILIDWSESFGGIGPQIDQVLNKNDARALAEGVGFTFEREFDAGDHHYGLAFRKG
ncbi:class I SAM-dependent methyltransferase [Candidatus Kaiserbacteria bacterium]|nr:class I SAM-dependent methyltransferase [Candidatus Kaiserbacteria bacterium]